jgi:hypothetical protein
MMVWEARNAVYEGLLALSWLRYMRAMWILGGELVSLYAGQLTGSEQSLASATLDVVRDVDVAGHLMGHEEQDAAALAVRWGQVIAEGEQRAPGGLLNVWMTFEGMAAEIAGSSAQFYAADWVMAAAVRRWRDPNDLRRRRVNPGEETADDSPLAHTLTTFAQIVERRC